MDTFHGHLSNKIRNRLRNKNITLTIIPRGMKSQLQPLDMSINTPYKHLVRAHYDAWLNKDNHISTHGDKIERASALIIVEWVSKAWKEVPVNIIPKSFSNCGVSNAEDGMQDDILWDDSKECAKGASSSENKSAIEE
jgi:hypothetical protein